MTSSIRILAALILVAVLGVAAAQATVLRYPITSDPATFEPGLAKELLTAEVALNLHVGLFTYDAETSVVPYLVSSFDVSDDGLTYTFQLHADATWHNGRPIVAQDFKLGWERYLEASLGAQTAGDPWRLVGGGPAMFAGDRSAQKPVGCHDRIGARRSAGIDRQQVIANVVKRIDVAAQRRAFRRRPRLHFLVKYAVP